MKKMEAKNTITKKSSLEYIRCNLCGSTECISIYKGIPEEKSADAVINYKSSSNAIGNDNVVKCKKCGLVYVNPRLKEEVIVGGYSEGSDETFVSQTKGREITFGRSLKVIEGYSKKGKILDVGTAGGSFLHVAKEKGWKVYGVEPNKWLCDWGKKNYEIDIKQGTMFDQHYRNNEFNVVTLWDVLEHVSDPKKTLIECNRVLKKDGLLVVNYPDFGSWIARIMGKRWVFLLTVHLFYFTPKTMKRLLDVTGFEMVKIKPHFQTLSLGYLVFRMKPYSKILYKIGNSIVNLLHMQNLQFIYWIGQTLVIARKK